MPKNTKQSEISEEQLLTPMSNYSPEAQSKLGNAIGQFAATYHRFAVHCRQALSAATLHFTDGKFTVAKADSFDIPSPESPDAEIFIGWFPVHRVTEENGKKRLGEQSGFQMKLTIRPGNPPAVTAIDETSGDECSGPFSEDTFKSIAEFMQ